MQLVNEVTPMVENGAHQPHTPQPVVVLLRQHFKALEKQLFAPKAAGIHLHQLFILVPQTDIVEAGL